MDQKTIFLIKAWLSHVLPTVGETLFRLVNKKRDGPSLLIMGFQMFRNVILPHGLDFVTNM
jgi:hypothetical protein